MKKLIAGLAIVACAMTASASSVTWGLGTGELLDSAKIDNGTAYLMYSVTSVDFTKFATMTSFDASSLAEVGLDTTIDTFSYSSSKSSNNVSVTPTGTKTSTNANIGGGAKPMYIVIIDDDGKNIAYTATSVSVNVQNSTMAVNATKAASAFTYAAAATGGGESVPEPTSGLLMLIGAAGLALRRKRA